jgi:hypothetical protein
MEKHTLLTILGLSTVVALFLWASARSNAEMHGAVVTQIPTVEPGLYCSGPGIEVAPGGSTVTLENIEIRLPNTGDFGIGVLGGGQGPFLTVCELATQWTVTIDARTGSPVARGGTSAAIDQVIANVVLASSAQPAATPTPTTPAQPLCRAPNSAGPATIEPVRGVVQVDLPAGNFDWSITPPIDEASFSICFVQGNARVVIGTDCREIRRQNPGNDPIASSVLDAIVASCKLISATPTPSSGANRAQNIEPPSTGRGGLR